MSLSTHYRAAELHNLASHAHTAAAVAHGKEDHLTAHETTMNREQLKAQIALQTEFISAICKRLMHGDVDELRREELEIEIVSRGHLRYAAVHALREMAS